MNQFNDSIKMLEKISENTKEAINEIVTMLNSDKSDPATIAKLIVDLGGMTADFIAGTTTISIFKTKSKEVINET